VGYPKKKLTIAGRIAALLILLIASTSGMRAGPLDDDAPASASPVDIARLPDGNAETGDSVQWNALSQQSMLFLGIEHSFRLATDPETRGRAGGSFVGGYVASLTTLHGWGDGDPFLVNYVGHPIQGAISGFIWIQNDPHYRTAGIGRNSRYWKGRLRAMAFAAVYSEEFEIGPLSEASIGHVQAYAPQQGFVDHVITPTVGMGWMVAEDAVDRYVIRPIEAHTKSRWVRLLARGILNPSRSFANCMALETPWHRDDRGGVMRP
jgi:hypothetical protein